MKRLSSLMLVDGGKDILVDRHLVLLANPQNQVLT